MGGNGVGGAAIGIVAIHSSKSNSKSKDKSKSESECNSGPKDKIEDKCKNHHECGGITNDKRGGITDGKGNPCELVSYTDANGNIVQTYVCTQKLRSVVTEPKTDICTDWCVIL